MSFFQIWWEISLESQLNLSIGDYKSEIVSIREGSTVSLLILISCWYFSLSWSCQIVIRSRHWIYWISHYCLDYDFSTHLREGQVFSQHGRPFWRRKHQRNALSQASSLRLYGGNLDKIKLSIRATESSVLFHVKRVP